MVIKRIQALAWWIRDREKRNVALDANQFDAAALQAAMASKRVEEERSEAEATVKDLGQFHPDDFNMHESAFLNLLAQMRGAVGEPLRYIACAQVAPADFVDTVEERMYQLPLNGPAFEEDNRAVYRKLKSFLIKTPSYAWIESYDSTENGRDAYLTWLEHYNGEGELSKRTAMAKAKIDQAHYKSEKSMSFENYTSVLTKCFTTLSKDEDQAYSDRQKVEKLLKGIKCSDGELIAAKAVIDQTYPRDFAGACAYFSSQVARVHGPTLNEYQRQRSKRRYVSAAGSDRGGRARGRFGGRGGGRYGRGGRGGRGGRQGGRGNQFNGVNISDPYRLFTGNEWQQLGPQGQAYVRSLREQQSGGGRGDYRGGGGGCQEGREGRRGVSSAHVEGQHQEVQADGAVSERGAQNGRGFGRGRYGGRVGGRG